MVESGASVVAHCRKASFPFAAGNFIYIGASDLVPEVNRHHRVSVNLVNFLFFASGLALLWAIRLTLG